MRLLTIRLLIAWIRQVTLMLASQAHFFSEDERRTIVERSLDVEKELERELTR